LWLICGDIGGTNGRLQLYKLVDKQVHLEKSITYRIVLFRDLKGLLLTFINDCANPKISSCVLAICGPVFENGRKNDANNLFTPDGKPWPPFTADELEDALNISRGSFRYVNDFEAIGYGIASTFDPAPVFSSLKKELSDSIITIYDVPRQNGQPIACLGAGTGLGAVYLTALSDDPNHYHVHPSEGGMVNIFSPENEEEWQLLKFLQIRYPDYVTIEAVVSGKGIINIYDFFKQQGKPIDPTADKEIKEADIDHKPAIIATYAKKGEATCLATLDLFLDVYARITAHFACTFISYGGVYIAGGVLPKILWRTQSEQKGVPGPFVSRYLKMGPSTGVVEQIPIYLITGDAGSFGCLYRAIQVLKNQ